MLTSRPSHAPISRRAILAGLAVTAGLGVTASRAAAPNRRHLVIDETTGFAIGGYDPVAYFIDSQPRRGMTEFQFEWRGGTWLFVNEGNLAAFHDRPDVYTPMFGGYCAFAVAQGRPAEGSPLHFTVYNGRLYLFANAASRLAFLEAAPSLAAEAAKRWPEVSRDLP